MAPRKIPEPEEDPRLAGVDPVESDNVNGFIWRPVLRDPPLCQLWQLTQTGPQTYSVVDLMLFHEAMDMENLARRRIERALEPEKKD
jgi:hypothetical protein